VLSSIQKCIAVDRSKERENEGTCMRAGDIGVLLQKITGVCAMNDKYKDGTMM